MAPILHVYRYVGSPSKAFLQKVQGKIPSITDLTLEYCFNVEKTNELDQNELNTLLWLFTETFEPELVKNASFLTTTDGHESIVEVGPRLAFSTAWSSNCVSMCQACGIKSVGRIERSRRYLIKSTAPLDAMMLKTFASLVHDRMTECVYAEPLESFDNGATAETFITIPLLEEGKSALEKLNKEKGLGFDNFDLEFYSNMFIETLKRNPTDVECFDLGQSNSEHSRHWFFSGKMIIDGEEKKETLFQMVKSTLPEQSNSVIAFHDNSSAIYGFEVDTLTPQNPLHASPMQSNTLLLHPILTAETHNFPSGVAPFPGAETGTGGRLRDVQATGRGAHTLAGISAYCVGNLNIPGKPMPWEPVNAPYPSNLALPLEIEVEASNGASDYGNKYGEPVVTGFTRSFGQRLPNGERYEWIKPIMFTAGVGMMDGRHAVKGQPEVGMYVCKVGGPAYRIGMGGGAASSRVQGTADADLDFDAVQRGDAEMENRMNRVIRACVELGEQNPIISIHDQGAGGNGNVLKEIVDPLGAKLELRNLPLGDPTLSVMEIWGAEYQENNAFLIKPESLEIVQTISVRENCPVTVVGTVTGDGQVVLYDASNNTTPFNLPLSLVLGKMPQKTFTFTSPVKVVKPLELPEGTTVTSALERILQLLDVGSKRFLTNKVDRCVTGLIAQQQCVGPLHTPLADVAVLAQSHFATTGVAVSVGEQPIKGLINNGAQARLTVGEALTNLAFAKITSLEDVKASGNWMWAAKLEGEGAKMYEACAALRDVLVQLGPAIDGGKDSLSMAAKVAGEVVKAPGEVTFTCYAPCPDITLTVTPDLKTISEPSSLVYVDLGLGKYRVGGTALTTVYAQVGDETPDLDDIPLFKRAFYAVQQLIASKKLAAGHDRSDGGLLTTILEMAFAGNLGVEVNLPAIANITAIQAMFGEELGFVFQVAQSQLVDVLQVFELSQVPALVIGQIVSSPIVKVAYGQDIVLNDSIVRLRDLWESTSFALEKLQCDPTCVAQEEQGLSKRIGPQYHWTYPVQPTLSRYLERPSSSKPRVAIIRQEGSNGDREMLSAFHSAGFEAWDVNMRDLLQDKVTLDLFRGVIFCGGFSYADVNDSAKGWAGVIKFNEKLLTQFNHFRDRSDTFSLGVCNGCQLMALLGWVPFPGEQIDLPTCQQTIAPKDQTRFIHNSSGRFESRWSSVTILPSPAVLLKDMVGSTLGVWVAHGEGKAYFPDTKQLELAKEYQLAPIRYVNDHNEITMEYPMNPNGSPDGIAGLCSPDGRHLALMPHPERCFLSWQWPYLPSALKEELYTEKSMVSPWMKLFQNARVFCEQE